MKKSVLSIIITAFFAFLAVFTSPAQIYAQQNPETQRWDIPSVLEQNNYTKQSALDNSASMERIILKQISADIPSALTCSLTGLLGCGARNEEEAKKLFVRSPLGMSMQTMAFLYRNPPTTTGQYLAYVSSRAGLVPKTYAQGITFSRLTPIIPVWRIFRNISFMLLSVIVMIAGILIMFRTNINPQTVAKIENTIPNIVITMILIAFSLPIAAFIIDLMYVAIAAGILIIGNAVGDPNVYQAVTDFTTGGFLVLVAKTMSPLVGFAQTTVNQASGGSSLWEKLVTGGWGAGLLSLAFPGISLAVIPLALLLGGAVGGISQQSIESGILSTLSPIFILIIFVILLFHLFKIFFILLSAYIQLIMSILFGPLILLWNAVPGQNSFTNWWKGIVSNCSVFVVTAIMLYLGWAITARLITSSFWVAPLVAQGVGVAQITGALLSLGIILTIPQSIALVKQMIGAKPIMSVGVGTVTGPLQGAVGKAAGFVQQYSALQTSGIGEKIPFVKKFFKK